MSWDGLSESIGEHELELYLNHGLAHSGFHRGDRIYHNKTKARGIVVGTAQEFKAGRNSDLYVVWYCNDRFRCKCFGQEVDLNSVVYDNSTITLIDKDPEYKNLKSKYNARL